MVAIQKSDKSVRWVEEWNPTTADVGRLTSAVRSVNKRHLEESFDFFCKIGNLVGLLNDWYLRLTIKLIRNLTDGQTTGDDDRFHDIFELHYIELRKFRKEYKELVQPLDRWLTFLTKAHELTKGRVPEPLASDQLIIKAINEPVD